MPFAQPGTIKFGDGVDEATSTQVGQITPSGASCTIAGILNLGTSQVWDGALLKAGLVAAQAKVAADPALGFATDLANVVASQNDPRVSWDEEAGTYGLAASATSVVYQPDTVAGLVIGLGLAGY